MKRLLAWFALSVISIKTSQNMYGIINKALEDLIKENLGVQKWDAILRRSGVDIDFFIGSEPYDDVITYKIAQAAADETNTSIDTIFKSMGEWWIMHTCKEKYRGMVEAGGTSMREFLVNLPVLHNRIMLIYPKLTPPEFSVTHITDRSLHLHYYSQRPGLREFVHGLLQGIATWYKIDATIELLRSRQDNSDHEEFRITW
jgi:hypothetical protein